MGFPQPRQHNHVDCSDCEAYPRFRLLRTLIILKDAELSSLENSPDAFRKYDKAVSKGVLHKNNAANKKSGFAKRVASMA